ncbi:MAG TPA: chitobiase/beta-hexosaminidase C-terminal domain-containing protein [Chryseolinea sp.]|nr:chitobiase/beta-hexosaminidase C-terminal domain-containing protein [Chryseolinea sp.]
MFRFARITINLAYFINVLLFFLLLFEDKVQLPVLLQVTGRMHPLVLHFPLALLFVGIFLEYLVSRKAFQHPVVLKITSGVFHVFALSAALTALLGFFLYQEGSYLGEEVLLHKWIGVAVSLFAVFLVWLKEKPAGVYYYIMLGVSTLCLILAGHLGAEVTHGKGFLTEPIRKQLISKIAPVENADSAVVFRDVIQPILNEKCLNCHNTNKAKNDLILSDYESLMKGGESRDVVVPGKADRSLLFKYVSLPMDDTLHMPPKEKMQLDREEIKLLGWWINTGAHAHEKYADLPKVDSIQTIMLSKFHPKTGLDLLDISFIDYEEIKRLNNPYRTVQQISATQPYIAVFLGSKKDFTAKDLTELKDIGSQVVSIDLGNSAVRDDDLKNLTQFPHIQKLHLQNSGVGDDGVKHLKDLRFLNVLNLSGTKVSTKTLNEVSGWENLKKLYLYNTSVPEESVLSLNKSHPELEVYNTQLDLTDTVYNAELTAPVIKIDSPFFHSRASIEVKLSRGKVKYYYTLDGTEPTANSTLYTESFHVRQSTEFKIRATMKGWKDSKVAVFPLMKLGIIPDRVILETKPDPKYSGRLDSTLVDGRAGSLNRGDKEYLGFTNRDPQVLFELARPKEISQLTLSFLEDVKSGVMAPDYVEVWGGKDKNNLTKLARIESILPQHERPAAKCIIKLNFPAQAVQFVRLKAKNAKTLPTLQNTTEPSIFIDEISLE